MTGIGMYAIPFPDIEEDALIEESGVTMDKLLEPAQYLPIIHDADLCVLGGSCTGVFAAVRAARLGLRVVIVEGHNCFGGVATNALVNIWHTLHNTEGNQQIIAGLTEEMIERLKRRNAVQVKDQYNPMHFVLNTEQLKIELDELVIEEGIKPYLHTLFVAPYVQDEKLIGVIVENKSGRGVIRAKAFVDATGDGDLAYRLGLETYNPKHPQPSTTCAKIGGWSQLKKNGIDFDLLFRTNREEYGLPEGFVWSSAQPGQLDLHMLAGTRVHATLSDADAWTGAEIEGRRQVRAILDMIAHHHPEYQMDLAMLPARIGVRETRHVKCLHQLSGDELLNGTRFEDAIVNGSYPSDLHLQGEVGIIFRYMNGVEKLVRPGFPDELSRWREAVAVDPTFYQLPFRAMVPQNSSFTNVIVAGRMIDSDMIAHAAIRVMVNMNQSGEAAGVAAYLAINGSIGFNEVDSQKLRSTLSAGGSCII